MTTQELEKPRAGKPGATEVYFDLDCPVCHTFHEHSARVEWTYIFEPSDTGAELIEREIVGIYLGDYTPDTTEVRDLVRQLFYQEPR